MVVWSVLALGCAGAGRFGYAREYVPLNDERAWQERTQLKVSAAFQIWGLGLGI
jgi:hypothetical protein